MFKYSRSRYLLISCVLVSALTSIPAPAHARPRHITGVVADLAVYNPNPTLMKNGAVFQDANEIHKVIFDFSANTRRPYVTGAAADGVTQVIIPFYTSISEGEVEFCLDGGTSDVNGGLIKIGTTELVSCVTAPVVYFKQGDETATAYVIYQTPKEFAAGGNEDKKERHVMVKAKYQIPGNPLSEGLADITLVRPPVVLIHGLWSSEDTWSFAMASDDRFSVTAADYSGSNAAYFADNRQVLRTFIDKALKQLNDNGYAATQVDIVGHSMGGILGRIHIASANYKRDQNFNMGDVHKIITLNTPHSGSPMANYIQDVRAFSPITRAAIEWLANAIGKPVDQGAIEDLAQGSSAILAIPKTSVPGHALVGTGGSDVTGVIGLIPNRFPGWAGVVWGIIQFFGKATDAAFSGQQHDAVVGQNSQEGGLSSSAYTVFGGINSIHTRVTGSGAYSDRIIELLNASAQTGPFANFPASANIPISKNASAITGDLIPVSIVAVPAIAHLSPGLTFISPTSGTQVIAGSIITVSVAQNPGTVITRVLVAGHIGNDDVAATSNSAQFQIPITIPVGTLGNFDLAALGTDGSAFYTSDILRLRVIPPPSATLKAITVLPKHAILFGIGDKQPFAVLGSYSDGIARDITSAAAQTVYTTSNSMSTTISLDGVATSVHTGTVVVGVQNGSQFVTATIETVIRPNQMPLAEPGPDRQVSLGTPVTLSGAWSFDPDNGPSALSYAWTQVSGPTTTLSSSVAVTTTFTPSVQGMYVFRLIVSDSVLTSTPKTVAVVVGDVRKTSIYLPLLRK